MFKFTASRSIPALSVLASLSILSFAAPALAADKDEEQLTMKVVKRNGQTLYCLDQAITGSRIPAHSCYTKSEWEHRGAFVHDDSRQQDKDTRSAEADNASDGHS